MFALMMFVYDGLKDCTPQMLGDIWVPIVALIVFGVSGLAVFAALTAKILKVSPYLAIATHSPRSTVPVQRDHHRAALPHGSEDARRRRVPDEPHLPVDDRWRLCDRHDHFGHHGRHLRQALLRVSAHY